MGSRTTYCFQGQFRGNLFSELPEHGKDEVLKMAQDINGIVLRGFVRPGGEPVMYAYATGLVDALSFVWLRERGDCPEQG